ncbi:cytochrome P450 [Pseudonocardia lutea]|uniref:Cytochrome P450 n=1 Tax=Pseudonocardia lutea TaxID=2172015 RepID=A0ABW1IHN7_9PSEU
MIALVEQRRAHPLDPEQDLMSGVLAARDEAGEPFPPEVPIAIGVQLFAAGGDTTTQAITAALHEIATTPEDQRTLRTEPALIPQAVEEYLRLHPPLHQLARTLCTDVKLHGQTMSESDLVALSWASTKRDADKFPDPDRCMIDRTPNRHLTFGNGPHQCIGAGPRSHGWRCRPPCPGCSSAPAGSSWTGTRSEPTANPCSPGSHTCRCASATTNRADARASTDESPVREEGDDRARTRYP